MSRLLPSGRPRASRSIVEATAILSRRMWAHDGPLPSPCLLFVRGYYRDTMGKKGINDWGLYDDAVFVLGPETFAAFNANVDPMVQRKGVGQVLPGWYRYRRGIHRYGTSRAHKAFRPATRGERLPVMRVGHQDPDFGIADNIHRGGSTSTSSLGCLTIPPAQWDAFYHLTENEMRRASAKTIDIGIVQGPLL